MIRRATLFALVLLAVSRLLIDHQEANAQAVMNAAWPTLDHNVEDVIFSPNGKTIASLINERGQYSIHLLDRSTGKPIGQFKTRCRYFRFASDGKSIFTWASGDSGDRTARKYQTYVYFYSIATCKVVRTVKTICNEDGAHDLVAEVDNKTIVVSGHQEVVAFYDITTGKQAGVIKGTHRVSTFVVSKDGKWLLTADYNSKTSMARLRLWDVNKKKLAHELYDHTREVTGLAFSPDGKWCASSTADGRLWVFDRAKGTEMGRTPTLWGGRRSLCFTADGKTLIAGGRALDGGLVWWDWQKDKDIRRGLWPKGQSVQFMRDLKNKAWHTSSMFLAPDGKHLYVATSRPTEARGTKFINSIVVWDLTRPFNPNPPKPREPRPEPEPELWWFWD